MIRTPLYRQTPPAIFPVTLGFLGLGNAWMGAAPVFGMPSEIGQVLSGLAVLFYIFFALSYVAKFALRPATLSEDLTAAPNRAGVAALTITLMLVSLVLSVMEMPVSLIWWLSVILYLIVVALVTRKLLSDPPEARQFTPFQYLSFVALIVAAIPGIRYGYTTICLVFALVSLLAYVVISVGWLSKLARVRPPQPLRPSIAMVLAPTSLFSIVFWMLGYGLAATIFYWLAFIIFIALLAASPWMTKGGWTPMWGAFTFPIAAFGNAQVAAYTNGMGSVAVIGLFAALAIGTPLILYIVYKHTMAWTRGDLSKKTGAAVA